MESSDVLKKFRDTVLRLDQKAAPVSSDHGQILKLILVLTSIKSAVSSLDLDQVKKLFILHSQDIAWQLDEADVSTYEHYRQGALSVEKNSNVISAMYKERQAEIDNKKRSRDN